MRRKLDAQGRCLKESYLDHYEALKNIRTGSSTAFRPIQQDLCCTMKIWDLHEGKQMLVECK